MDENFRFETGRIEPEIQTLQDFSDSMGILRAAENAMAQVIAAITIGRWVYVSELPCYSTKRHTTRARANAHEKPIQIKRINSIIKNI
jgi:hypothetical protein